MQRRRSSLGADTALLFVARGNSNEKYENSHFR
jgi:hypothetical protein